MPKYMIGVGFSGVAVERHILEARNQIEARNMAISKFLHPDKGYDHVEVMRMPSTKKGE